VPSTTRSVSALRHGRQPENARTKSPYVPFVYIVSPPAGYGAINGMTVKAADFDLVARSLLMQRVHKAIQVSGSLCTDAAARGSAATD
jgi:2-methylaconitate cis-trans-isomerase PrpF